MKKAQRIWGVILLFLLFLISSVCAQTVQPFLVPGLVLGLRHNMNQELISKGTHMVFFSAPPGAPVTRMHGGDLGAPLHRGYEWWMVRDSHTADPNFYKLPPGIVLGLKHSKNQCSIKITVFGKDTLLGPDHFYGFKKYSGGDLGAKSGEGYYWYESTGEGFSDWNIVEKLPKWTILGLKHSKNQPNKVFFWKGKKYDPADPNITPPPGFQRVSGGDRNGATGVGYYWYEKVTGPEIIVEPNLSIKLSQSVFVSALDPQNVDLDHDGLIDTLEGKIAMSFSPHLIFDSDENARQVHEPVVLFQVHPLDLTKKIAIKWVFLFKQDGGYGPSSWCKDSHPGDNDDAYYELISYDQGLTWTIIKIKLSFKGLEWPTNSRLEVDELTHPIIYMSAHKHHMYFTRDRDNNDSLYSDWGCNDDVNGQGCQVRANVISFRKVNSQYPYNNVGELKFHPSPPFVNDLSPFYPGQSAWQDKNFYDAGNMKAKWIK